MNIGIIGTGNVGGALGRQWLRAGHTVQFGSRDAAKAKDFAAQTGGGARGGSIAEAARFGDIVVFATPWPATESAIRAAGSLAGKIVVDCTNPLKADLSGLEVAHTDSAAEHVARWAAGGRVVKAFNTTGANIMADPAFGAHRAVMPVCGDDDEAKQIVMKLAADCGFDAVDVGGLAVARLLEPFAMLWIHLAYVRKMGREFAFGLLRR